MAANASQLARSRLSRIVKKFKSMGFKGGETYRDYDFGGQPQWTAELRFRAGGASTDEHYEVIVKDSGDVRVRERGNYYPSESRDAMVREMGYTARAIK